MLAIIAIKVAGLNVCREDEALGQWETTFLPWTRPGPHNFPGRSCWRSFGAPPSAGGWPCPAGACGGAHLSALSDLVPREVRGFPTTGGPVEPFCRFRALLENILEISPVPRGAWVEPCLAGVAAVPRGCCGQTSSRRRLGSAGPAAFLCCRRPRRAPLPDRARVRAARLLQLTPAVRGLVSWAVPVDCPRPAAVAAAPTRAALWSVTNFLFSASQWSLGRQNKGGRGG